MLYSVCKRVSKGLHTQNSCPLVKSQNFMPNKPYGTISTSLIFYIRPSSFPPYFLVETLEKKRKEKKHSQLSRKMSAVVEMWMSELGKLGQKVEAAGKRRLVLLSSKLKKEEEEEEAASKENIKSVVAQNKASSSTSTSTSTLSEDTVFWLMDRFAPL